jgi:hypothetical protein
LPLLGANDRVQASANGAFTVLIEPAASLPTADTTSTTTAAR